MLDANTFHQLLQQNYFETFFKLSKKECLHLRTTLEELPKDVFSLEKGKKDKLSLEKLIKCFPKNLIDRLSFFKNHSNSIGAFLIQGLPADLNIGITGDVSEKHTFYSEYILLAISEVFGFAYGYESQREGDIIQNLYPKIRDQNKQLGTGAIQLDWHTEDAFHPYRCNHILLNCIRGDENAHTFVSKINPFLLDSKIIEELMKPNYIITSDDAHENIVEQKTCVIEVDGYNVYTRYDPIFTSFLNKKAENAFYKLTQFINDNCVRITLKKGDLLIIDNSISIHGRSGFTPKFNGKDRWLQRLVTLKTKVPQTYLTSNYNIIKSSI